MGDLPPITAFNRALMGDDILEMVDAGDKAISSGMDLSDETISSYKRVKSIYTCYQRLQKAIQQEDDVLIADIWKMNYELVNMFLKPKEKKRVDVALQRVANLSSIRSAFHNKDAKNFIRLYDPVLYANCTLFGNPEAEYYREARLQIRIVQEIEEAAKDDDDRMLFLLYPEDLENIEPLLSYKVKEKIHKARRSFSAELGSN